MLWSIILVVWFINGVILRGRVTDYQLKKLFYLIRVNDVAKFKKKKKGFVYWLYFANFFCISFPFHLVIKYLYKLLPLLVNNFIF